MTTLKTIYLCIAPWREGPGGGGGGGGPASLPDERFGIVSAATSHIRNVKKIKRQEAPLRYVS